jgi:hypothetical protein
MHLRLPRSPLVALLSLALSGCSSLTSPSTQGMSASQAQSFAQQLSTALSNGVSGAHPGTVPISLSQVSNRSAGISKSLVNVSVAQRTNCTAGGYINVTGGMTGSISDAGTGVLSMQITETINDWQCIGGFTVNGDPYITVTGTFPFLSGALSSAATLTLSGGFKWTGNGSGSCQMTLTTLIYANGTGHTSGVMCAQQVDVTF